MDETCCNAYTTGEVNYLPSMEDILCDGEYAMYNEDLGGNTPLDDLIYYQLFECAA
jgi:hypothetical protein